MPAAFLAGGSIDRVNTTSVVSLLSAIEDTGRDTRRGGYSRPVYSSAELQLREWFTAEAARRGLAVETDRNGILWAWWDLSDSSASAGPAGVPDRRGALVTGSHLDSVPGGGAFDGPLGVASALAAVDLLRARERDGSLVRNRALAVAVFPEEEGSRFGVACLGSRLLAGTIDPRKALALRDADGNTFADVSRTHGLDPEAMGRDDAVLRTIGDFVELHVEQGQGLNTEEFTDAAGRGPALAVGGSILGHGRWRFSFTGQGNHAGTTLMTDRADPMVAAAQLIVAVRQTASAQPGARGTVGRLEPVPGGTNVIASRVELWLDVRHPDDAVTASLVEKIHGQAQKIAAFEGCTVHMTEESSSGTVHFDPALQRSLEQSVARTVPGAPVLATGAGHDAGVLAARVPTGMLFVRNPSGISHSPEEYVENDDADAGVTALADVLEDLL
ncbi:allantoate amidohydrolase [Arthrobacter jiangjiafuii]|uniref:Allantoate amidohydrolase n=1 Tax=Arthrobacter jiangjiafuii TaxID=2817475 RepID=A0A975M6W0_9MICC|nr:allantoate amidohydrolase [Arthrobacter jiangjiafuii]MBP3044027.1 allantoate amidohydrolase [Arthrobacter jiangjiafuii]QWC11017.1 allantoate amidohydrolase [Arthrobacter jiangjiafuii]